MLITNSISTDFFIFAATLIVAGYFYIKNKYNYWTKKGIPQLTPVFPFGNYFKGLPEGISLGAHSKTFYDEFKKLGHSFGGVYLGLDPYLVVVDASYVKDILTKDFQNFTDRGIYVNEKNYITVSLLTQAGSDWRNTRAKFTNIFTSVKMKFFYKTLKDCSDELHRNLELLTTNGDDIDIYEMLACYTTDVIGSVVFGIEANSFKHPDAIFRKLGRQLFSSFTLTNQLALFLTICYPGLAKKIGISNIQPNIEEFFYKTVTDTIEYREKNNIYRSDFLQLLIDMRKSEVNLTMKEMVAQAFLFFSAGFETSSASSTYAIFELGLNKDIQNKVREEINTVLEKYDGEITYESIKDMTYLDQVFYETLRKYPLLTTINRVCVKDYKVKNSDVFIEKGTALIFPVLGYHRDPTIFPDPLTYNPDRFKDKSVKYDGFLPFGEGPRNCIGSRFGLMQVKLGLVQIIKNFEVTVSPRTEMPLTFNEKSFVTKMNQTVYVQLKKIS